MDKFENLDPDVPIITKRLNQIRRKDDQLPTYDKDQGTFVKGNKKGALSDFKIIEAYHITPTFEIPCIVLVLLVILIIDESCLESINQ